LPVLISNSYLSPNEKTKITVIDKKFADKIFAVNIFAVTKQPSWLAKKGHFCTANFITANIFIRKNFQLYGIGKFKKLFKFE
jgi:hypothetical protein